MLTRSGPRCARPYATKALGHLIGTPLSSTSFSSSLLYCYIASIVPPMSRTEYSDWSDCAVVKFPAYNKVVQLRITLLTADLLPCHFTDYHSSKVISFPLCTAYRHGDIETLVLMWQYHSNY